ncbi:carbonic anhydrase [Synergistales bacterium]|nr:carbonic anhydrase [Synergistales bacterium]
MRFCGLKKKFLFMSVLLWIMAFSGYALAAHWGYEGETGPGHWGAMNPDYGLAIGNRQSPVDIVESAISGHGKTLSVHYRDGYFTIINNGHTIQCAPIATGENYITLDGEKYELQQFHLHAPAEHTINGTAPDMELHFVHRDATGRLAVMALFFDKGDENAALSAAWSEIAKFDERAKPKPLKDILAITNLLPENLATIQYNGSLTTPPTNEGVLWVVLKGHAKASMAQLSAFNSTIGNNARPTQPLNGRIFYESENGDRN